MSGVTSPKKSKADNKSIREREQEAREIVEGLNEQEPFNFTKKDLFAMIIAGYQVILPYVFGGALVIILCYFLFFLFMK